MLLMGVTLVNEALCCEQGCIKHPFNHIKRFSELKSERFVLYSSYVTEKKYLASKILAKSP